MKNHDYQISTEERALLSIAISTKISLIAFFSSTEEEQVSVLPTLIEERKYDFPDGDYISSNVIDILSNAYESSCLNSISLNLMWTSDTNGKNREKNSQVRNLISELHSLVHQATSTISEEEADCTDAQARLQQLPKIERIRELSRVVMKASGIQIQLTKAIMRACIDSYLHA